MLTGRVTSSSCLTLLQYKISHLRLSLASLSLSCQRPCQGEYVSRNNSKTIRSTAWCPKFAYPLIKQVKYFILLSEGPCDNPGRAANNFSALTDVLLTRPVYAGQQPALLIAFVLADFVEAQTNKSYAPASLSVHRHTPDQQNGHNCNSTTRHTLVSGPAPQYVKSPLPLVSKSCTGSLS